MAEQYSFQEPGGDHLPSESDVTRLFNQLDKIFSQAGVAPADYIAAYYLPGPPDVVPGADRPEDAYYYHPVEENDPQNFSQKLAIKAFIGMAAMTGLTLGYSAWTIGLRWLH